MKNCICWLYLYYPTIHMEKRKTIFLILLLSGIIGLAQNPSCSSGFIYMDNGSWIDVYDPGQPLSATNPSATSIPSIGGGLTLMPNISNGTLSPTFYTTSGGTYWYWSGTAWVNTGHTTGNSSAVNIAGCGSTIYNIVGTTGQVYSYNGSGAGSLLTTLANFNGGGPYDLVTDCNCNFYALNTTVPNQGLSMYNASGSLLCTYTLSGMPNTFAGGGFAILGNTIYVKNNTTPGFFIGTISGGGVTFTAVTGFNSSPGDFASCSVCYPSVNLAGSTVSGGTLSCTFPTLNVVATTTASPVTYAWSGPGIIGPASSSVILVNTPGTYSCLIVTATCPPSQITLTTTITSNTVAVLATLTPSGNVCAQMNASTHLTVAHLHSNDAILWNGPSIPALSGTDNINVTSPGSYTVRVTDIVSGCSATSAVSIVLTPTVSLALSDNTLCLHNYNGSPASITLTPSGATTYTLLTSSNYSTTAPNSTLMPCFPVTIFGNYSPNATATLVGSNGVCKDTTTTLFSIIPNPVIQLSDASASICPGGSKQIAVIGASQYLWGGSTGLNSYVGSNVVASPNASSIYSVVGGVGGCQSQTQTVSIIVLPVPTVSVNPVSSTICLGSSAILTATGTATSFTWSPLLGLLSLSNGPVVNVSPANTTTYLVVGSLNSCTNSASASVQVMQPPVLGLNLSSPTLCAQSLNFSPNSISLNPTGATNYTLLPGSGISINSPNGPVMQAIPVAPFPFVPSVASVTLIGNTGVCTRTINRTFTIIPNPVISVSPLSASTCPGHSKAFSVSGATTYTWLPMPNYTLTGSNSMVANPPLTSFYSVIGKENGCVSATKNAVLIVLPIPEVSVSPQSPTVCAGNSIVLNAVGNGSLYSWSPGGSLSSSSGLQVIATPASLQSYTVTATLNTCTNYAVATVSVIVMPVIHASASQTTICSSANTNLSVTGANSFLWFPTNNLNFPSGSQVVASPNESTTYTVHGYNGICTGSTTIYIKTIQRPDLDVMAEANQVCSGGSVPLVAVGAQSYTWIPVNGLIPTGTNGSVIVAPKVSTNFTVLGANSLGSVSCYQETSYSVSVIPEIVPVVSQNVSICNGDKTTLYAMGGNSFNWAPSVGLNVTNGAGVVANPRHTTIYTVEVSQNTFCGKTTTVMVTVNARPEVYAGKDTSYNLNEAIFLNARGTGTLTWVRGEDIICAVCPQTQVFPTRNGCYVVEALDDSGCKATDDICIELTEDFSIYIPNSFTPNNDGKNDHFLIFGENISQVSMEIYDRWGVKVFYSEDYTVGWDGRYKDVLCPTGAYTYIIRYTGLNRKKYTKSGNVNIVK